MNPERIFTCFLLIAFVAVSVLGIHGIYTSESERKHLQDYVNSLNKSPTGFITCYHYKEPYTCGYLYRKQRGKP